MNGPLWKAGEDAKLRELAPTGIGSHEIAKIIGRTQSAVRSRAEKLGVSIARSAPPPPPSPYFAANADRLSEWANVPLQLAQLVAKAADEADITLQRLRSPVKRADIVRVRWNIAREARRLNYSYSTIGRALNRDHTTVIYGIRRGLGA